MNQNFKVIATGSSANSYILEASNECLLIEAGLPVSKVSKYIEKPVAGLLVSHSHGDHAKYVQQYSDRGYFILCDSITAINNDLILFDLAVHKKRYQIGEFEIIALSNIHDVECYSYLIFHQEIGKFLFISDTNTFRYRIKDVGYIAISINYINEILLENALDNDINRAHFDHITNYHMSLEAAEKVIAINDNANLRNIFIIHTSGSNSSAEIIESSLKNITTSDIIICQNHKIYEL